MQPTKPAKPLLNIRRQPLGQEAAHLLRNMITQGKLAHGQRLIEERLAAELGLSRTPVREALHRLEQEGLLQKRPLGGYEVRPLQPRDVEDALGVRAVLEAYAGRLAASRRTERQLRQMERCLEKFRQALQKSDEKALVHYNHQFHYLLFGATDSPLVIRFLNVVHEEVARMSHALISNMAAARWSMKDHSAILAAITSRDADRTGELCSEHVRRGEQWLTHNLHAVLE